MFVVCFVFLYFKIPDKKTSTLADLVAHTEGALPNSVSRCDWRYCYTSYGSVNSKGELPPLLAFDGYQRGRPGGGEYVIIKS